MDKKRPLAPFTTACSRPARSRGVPLSGAAAWSAPARWSLISAETVLRLRALLDLYGQCSAMAVTISSMPTFSPDVLDDDLHSAIMDLHQKGGMFERALSQILSTRPDSASKYPLLCVLHSRRAHGETFPVALPKTFSPRIPVACSISSRKIRRLPGVKRPERCGASCSIMRPTMSVPDSN